jgi:hypothetical protein
MRALRRLLGPLVVAVLLLHSALGPVRCLSQLGPLGELAAVATFCGTHGGAADDHGAGPHGRADHVCAVCAGLGHAVAADPPTAPMRAVRWFAAPAVSLRPMEGPAAPRAPPLLPRAPPPIS